MRTYVAVSLIGFLCASAHAEGEVKAKLPPMTRALVAPQSSSNGDGRFVFGQISDFRADQYMLDTKTGRLWKIVLRSDGRGDMLQLVPYGSDDGASMSVSPPQ